MRYALYFTPPKDDPLTKIAARWLGRDAFSDEDLTLEPVNGFSDDRVMALTSDPRRYGFHATLKAPFQLADGQGEDALVEALGRFSSDARAFDIPSVTVGQLGPFFALIPEEPHRPLQDFAASVVETFEPFRAPLSDADIARRKPEKLNDAQRANLMRWGYPCVMEEFRFHMTLTGPVEPDASAAVATLLQERFVAFCGRPLRISGLALCVEKDRGAPFTIHSWLPLGGA
ncbi:MAG: DUF1045 domain-containing protein [Allorhizobium sp.]